MKRLQEIYTDNPQYKPSPEEVKNILSKQYCRLYDYSFVENISTLIQLSSNIMKVIRDIAFKLYAFSNISRLSTDIKTDIHSYSPTIIQWINEHYKIDKDIITYYFEKFNIKNMNELRNICFLLCFIASHSDSYELNLYAYIYNNNIRVDPKKIDFEIDKRKHTLEYLWNYISTKIKPLEIKKIEYYRFGELTFKDFLLLSTFSDRKERYPNPGEPILKGYHSIMVYVK